MPDDRRDDDLRPDDVSADRRDADRPPRPESKRILCGVLAILLGSWGVHKFVLGYTVPGVIMLVVTLLSCGGGVILLFPFCGMGVMGLIGLIEGIIYLTKTDAEFVRTYQDGKKEWF